MFLNLIFLIPVLIMLFHKNYRLIGMMMAVTAAEKLTDDQLRSVYDCLSNQDEFNKKCYLEESLKQNVMKAVTLVGDQYITDDGSSYRSIFKSALRARDHNNDFVDLINVLDDLVIRGLVSIDQLRKIIDNDTNDRLTSEDLLDRYVYLLTKVPDDAVENIERAFGGFKVEIKEAIRMAVGMMIGDLSPPEKSSIADEINSVLANDMNALALRGKLGGENKIMKGVYLVIANEMGILKEFVSRVFTEGKAPTELMDILGLAIPAPAAVSLRRSASEENAGMAAEEQWQRDQKVQDARQQNAKIWSGFRAAEAERESAAAAAAQQLEEEQRHQQMERERIEAERQRAIEEQRRAAESQQQREDLRRQEEAERARLETQGKISEATARIERVRERLNKASLDDLGAAISESELEIPLIEENYPDLDEKKSDIETMKRAFQFAKHLLYQQKTIGTTKDAQLKKWQKRNFLDERYKTLANKARENLVQLITEELAVRARIHSIYERAKRIELDAESLAQCDQTLIDAHVLEEEIRLLPKVSPIAKAVLLKIPPIIQSIRSKVLNIATTILENHFETVMRDELHDPAKMRKDIDTVRRLGLPGLVAKIGQLEEALNREVAAPSGAVVASAQSGHSSLSLDGTPTDVAAAAVENPEIDLVGQQLSSHHSLGPDGSSTIESGTVPSNPPAPESGWRRGLNALGSFASSARSLASRGLNFLTTNPLDSLGISGAAAVAGAFH